MKPGDHPEFFRLAPPEGRSRESTIVLGEDGRFTHDGVLVAHRRLEQAMHTWISRHPDDGRYILTNGYDWTYFEVRDAPYTVTSVLDRSGAPILVLSDDSREALDPTTLVIRSEHLYARVKVGAPGGPYEARFSRHAMTDLAPWLDADERDGAPTLTVGGVSTRLAQ